MRAGLRRLAAFLPPPQKARFPSVAARFTSKWVVIPLLIIALLIWVAAATAPDDRLHLSFLDVGHGDAILIQTPSHYQILVDGGASPQRIALELGKRLPFWDRTIDLLVSTHPHEDHLLGLVEVLQRYQVKQVLESGIPYDSASYEEWHKLIGGGEVKRTLAQAGQVIDLGRGAKLQVLHPQSFLLGGTSSDVDNNSLVLRLDMGGVSFLLTGDIHEEAESYLIDQGLNLGSVVLKVAHHGSKTSTSPGFLAEVSPQVAVISVDIEDEFGHPNPEVVARLEERLGEDRVYLTSERGTIELITDGEMLWIKTER